MELLNIVYSSRIGMFTDNSDEVSRVALALGYPANTPFSGYNSGSTQDILDNLDPEKAGVSKNLKGKLSSIDVVSTAKGPFMRVGIDSEEGKLMLSQPMGGESGVSLFVEQLSQGLFGAKMGDTVELRAKGSLVTRANFPGQTFVNHNAEVYINEVQQTLVEWVKDEETGKTHPARDEEGKIIPSQLKKDYDAKLEGIIKSLYEKEYEEDFPTNPKRAERAKEEFYQAATIELIKQTHSPTIETELDNGINRVKYGQFTGKVKSLNEEGLIFTHAGNDKFIAIEDINPKAIPYIKEGKTMTFTRREGYAHFSAIDRGVKQDQGVER
jgi:cold shock CspA family protein